MDNALRAILDQGGSMATHWDIKRVFEVADRGTGYPLAFVRKGMERTMD